MIVYITRKSLWNRCFTSFLCILSVALSMALFLGVSKVKEGAEEGFTNTISKTDLIVGAKGGPLQLLLYSVFHLGSATNNIRYSTYQKMRNNPAIKWTIPISLGDSYKGYRVVGTDENYFRHYRFRGDQKPHLAEGKIFESIWDVVIGSDIAKRFQLRVGDPIALSHGLSRESILKHTHSPFKVSGVLGPTSTPIDKALYISLYGMEVMHIGWESGVPSESDMAEKEKLTKKDLNPYLEKGQITAFFVAAKNRIFTLRLRSMVDSFEGEPIMGIIPGITLQELWNTIGYVEKALGLVSLCVLIVGLLGVVISLYTSINERRREMAILRSLGASGKQILLLLLTESALLVGLGAVLGVTVLAIGMGFLGPYLASEFSVYIPAFSLGPKEWVGLGLIAFSGILIGLIPGIKAYKQSLQDGLTVQS